MVLGFNNGRVMKSDEHLTPPELIAELGYFDLDPCSPSPKVRPWDTALNHYCLEDDGLARPWFGRVWCNPPYGDGVYKWLDKLATHGNGVALVFARTETRGFHAQVWARADAVFFFKGRVKFYTIDGARQGNPNAPSCLAIYGESNVKSVSNSMLDGKLVKLRP